ncbi:MAG: isoleucine--tRNA ligase [Eubacteriales bacterium]|nr:isoleucine--tRNA ligase [Clostridium sp.]MDY6088501.1 isoleucine--tRNA ligase [Eubacteriales bacterium]
MYKKVSTSLDFVEREREVLEFWKQNHIFEESVRQNRGKPAYTFYDGPPTANGRPHIGHVLTRSMKDIIPRYRTMKGYDVLRKAGWDTHGLPVELEVEKSLGLDGKEQIEGYGVLPFIEKCKESVWKYKGEWEHMSDAVGYWADMEHPYVTYTDDYIESVWWALKTIDEKGLLYKGHKIVPYCPRCGTALSSHEVAQGYKDVKETSIFVTFPAIPDEKHPFIDGSESFIAWTTTPWTLPSNVGLCVNADEDYVIVLHEGKKFILAKALAENVLGEEIEELASFKGSELIGIHYKPLFDFTVNHKGKDAWRIVADDYVTLTDGAGIVHLAPAFGEDDARVGRKWELPFVQLVSPKGELTGGTPWDGIFVKKADKPIIEDLRSRGRLLKELPYEHSYPFCWRCDTPLIYYARESWFVKTTAVRERMVENNKKINWIPESIGEGRMGNFLENVIDWGISRERYWGTPLPVWMCPDCGHYHVMGSRAELRSYAPEVPEDIELHKPMLDPITFRCEKCGGTMKREPVVIDCWFDSGSMPFAQWHYPFENKEEFERRFPADYISEAVDQTRGWFYTLSALSTILFDKPAFKNCIVLGLVCDKDGKKMSKHVGNVVAPADVLNKQGADAVRWYFYTASSPWLPSRFSGDAVSETQRKYMGTLWNTYAFYILYADIDEFDPTKHTLVRENLSVMDKWLLSRLNTLIGTVDDYLDKLRITEAGRELNRFVDDLSNWYVRQGRERYWGKEMTPDKEAAYMTLYTALETLCRLTAPFTPFIAESIYQNIVRSVDENAPKSVHLTTFPVCDESFIDKELEAGMDSILSIVTLGRAARSLANTKNRQPLSEMFVQGIDELPELYTEIIESELNVKAVRYVKDASAFISYRVKPQLKLLGPRYGKLLPKINAYLQQDGMGNQVVAAHAEGRNFEFELEGTPVSLGEADVLVDIVKREGYASVSDKGITVVLNTTLTTELIEEGLVRELVSKIQTMRKEAGFEVTDKINITLSGSEKVAAIAEKYASDIMGDTLAVSLTVEAPGGYVKNWDINGEEVELGVERCQ